MFPLHTWLPDAPGEANAPVSMLLAGVLLKMGGYGIMRLGLTLAPTFTVDPNIIGGLIVRVGDTVYDQSIATSLVRLGSRLKQRSIHEIQYRRDRLGTP